MMDESPCDRLSRASKWNGSVTMAPTLLAGASLPLAVLGVDLARDDHPGMAVLLLVACAGALAAVHRLVGNGARRRALAAHRDPLTGLPGRETFVRALAERAGSEGAAPERIGICAVRVCNLDLAAASLSTEEIRRVLRTQARRLDALCGGHVPVARLREDTFAFAVIARDADKAVLDDATAAVHALSKPIALDDGAYSPRASAGVAPYAARGESADDAVDHALSALAIGVQNASRQVVTFHPATRARMRDALELERALRDAVNDRRLHLVFQPIIDAASGRTVGSEALVRWRHPTHGDVPPSTFIPIAERCGLVAAIDRFVLEEAGRRTMAWRSRLGLPDLFVSVNLSATQFRDTHLTGWIAGLLRAAFVDPSAVMLEVTETAALPDLAHGSAVVRQLRDLGVRVALDDFGTGHSWLSYLGRIEVDRLKIDQSFVRNVHQSARDRAICAAVVDLARGLSLSVVAEGVEREEHARCLRELGVDLLQGYHFAGPLTPERFEAFARESRDRHARSPRGRGARVSLVAAS